MSYFLPRARVFKETKGSLADVRWPAAAEVVCHYGPPDLFGVETDNRSVVKVGVPVQTLFDARIGHARITSAGMLEPFAWDIELPRTGVRLEGRADRITATSCVASLDQLSNMVQLVDQILPTYFTLLASVYVSVEDITGRVGSAVAFRCEISKMRLRLTGLEESHRTAIVNTAAQFADSIGAEHARLAIACHYFRQAVRLTSPVEHRVPELNSAEVVVNLAKSLEMLFAGLVEGNTRDSIRTGCPRLGYTDGQIQSQVIPLMLARDSLDGAHPVGARVPQELVAPLRTYTDRALDNVRSILIRAARQALSGELQLRPVEDSDRDKERLLGAIERYCNDPALPRETPP